MPRWVDEGKFKDAVKQAHALMGARIAGMQYSLLAAQRAEEAQQAAIIWCYQMGGFDPHKIANMTLAEFAEMCVKNMGMPEPPDIPRKVLAGLRYLGKKAE